MPDTDQRNLITNRTSASFTIRSTGLEYTFSEIGCSQASPLPHHFTLLGTLTLGTGHRNQALREIALCFKRFEDDSNKRLEANPSNSGSSVKVNRAHLSVGRNNGRKALHLGCRRVSGHSTILYQSLDVLIVSAMNTNTKPLAGGIEIVRNLKGIEEVYIRFQIHIIDCTV